MIGAAHIAKGARTFDEWAEAMREDGESPTRLLFAEASLFHDEISAIFELERQQSAADTAPAEMDRELCELRAELEAAKRAYSEALDHARLSREEEDRRKSTQALRAGLRAAAGSGTLPRKPQPIQTPVTGTPSLTILIVALICFSAYRCWVLGWPAIPGNLRLIALVAIGLAVTVVVSGPLWTFGLRSRKKALLLLVIALTAFAFLNVV